MIRTRTVLLLCAIAGCEARAETPRNVHIVKPAAPAPVLAKPSPALANVDPRAFAAASPEARSKLVEAFLAKDILKAGPEKLTERFASMLPLARENESPDGFVLRGATPAEVIEIHYGADGKGGFYCQQGILRFRANGEAEVTSLRQALETQLRARVGKSKKYDPESTTLYYKFGRYAELSLSDTLTDGGPDYHVELNVSEPDGP